MPVRLRLCLDKLMRPACKRVPKGAFPCPLRKRVGLPHGRRQAGVRVQCYGCSALTTGGWWR